MNRIKRARQKIDGRGFEDAAYRNVEAEGDYFERLKKIAISLFEWVNLPDSMDARFLELCLFYYGQAALLYDESYGFINTKCATDGYLNIYGLPTGLNCYSFGYDSDRSVYHGGDNFDKNKSCILVMNNADRLSTASTIDLYARRLADADRTAEVNIRNQKFPLIISVDEKQRLAAKQMFKDIAGNEPVIFADKNQMIGNSIQALKTDVPFIADKVMEYKKQIWNEYLTFLGINNIDVEKKERLIASEATTNNEVTNLNLMSYFAPRKYACEQFNKLFGLTGDKKVSVKVRSDLYNIIKETESIVTDSTKYDMEYLKDNSNIDLGESEGE